MTWYDYIMTYYDVMDLCYFYVVFRKKFSKVCLFSIYIQLLLDDSTLFFSQFWKNIWIIKVFFGLYKHFSEWIWKKK